MAEPGLLERLQATAPDAKGPTANNLLGRLKAIDKAESATGRSRPIEFETSPLPAPKGNLRVKQNFGVTSPFSAERSVQPLVQRAADAGVVFDKPAPSGQALASLAFDEPQALAAYRKSLAKTYGREIAVRRGPETGEIEYLDPETNRFALVTPPGAALSSLESMAGDALTLLPELAAGGLAAVLTRHPVAVNFAASLGVFGGEIGRLVLGRNLGVNEDVSDEEIIGEATKKAGVALVAGKVTDDVMRLGKLGIDFFSGRVMDRRVLEGGNATLDEATRVADEINTRIGRDKFRFNLAQATNDPDLLSMQEFFKRSPEFQGLFRDFDETQRAALGEYMAAISRPYNSAVTDKAAAGAMVQNVAKADVGREALRADLMVQMREAELEALLSSRRSRPFEATGAQLREAVAPEQQALRDWSKQAVAQIDTLAGGAEFIAGTNTRKAVTQLASESRRALLPKQARQGESLIGRPPEADAPPEAISKIFDPNAKFGFGELWDAISYLKRLERVSAKGLSSEEPAVGSITFLRAAMERDLREGTQGTPLGEMYDRFIVRYAQEKHRLDEGLVGQIMERRGGRNGRFVVADEDVFRKVFRPGDVRASRELHAAIENRPATLDAMRESIVDFYQRQVVKDGRIDPNAHRRFMSQYRDVLPVWFNRRDLGSFRKAGNAEGALRAREEARERLTKDLSKTFEGQIADARNPSQVLTLVWDANDPSKMRRLVSMLDKTVRGPGGGVFRPHADILRAVRSEGRKEMLERVAGEVRGGERVLSATRLGDFLDGKGGEKGYAGVLRELYGEGYVKDLRTLHRALVIAGREPAVVNRSNTAFWQDTVKGLARAYVGLFTRPGRFITAMDRVRGRAANRAIVKAMVNPEQLRDLMALRGVDARSRKAAALLGNFGASAFLSEGPE